MSSDWSAAHTYPGQFVGSRSRQPSWNNFKPVFTEDYLLQLAEAALPEPDDAAHHRDQIRSVTLNIDRLRDEKIKLARKLEEDDRLNFLEEVIAQIDDEISDHQQPLEELERRAQAQAERETVEEDLSSIAEKMSDKLDDLDDEEYEELADILQLEIERVGTPGSRGRRLYRCP